LAKAGRRLEELAARLACGNKARNPVRGDRRDLQTTLSGSGITATLIGQDPAKMRLRVYGVGAALGADENMDTVARRRVMGRWVLQRGTVAG
jgi:hypothetical protein